MSQVYVTPEMETIYLCADDVVRTSGLNDGGYDDGKSETADYENIFW